MADETDRPAAGDCTVRSVRRHEEPTPLEPGGWRRGIQAELRLADGTALILSRLDGETGWTADAAFGPTGVPQWANGFGARYLRTWQLRPDLAGVVDDAAQAAGLLERPQPETSVDIGDAAPAGPQGSEP